jgi:hypothetical protein
MTASDVEIKVLAAEGGRPGTSRVQLQLQQKQVAPVMPVVTASSSGVMHNVAKTWTFLKVRVLCDAALVRPALVSLGACCVLQHLA